MPPSTKARPTTRCDRGVARFDLLSRRTTLLPCGERERPRGDAHRAAAVSAGRGSPQVELADYGPNTCTVKNESPYGVARDTPNTRTYRAETAVNDVSFTPAPVPATVATSVNAVPFVDT